jgi:peptide deformylase
MILDLAYYDEPILRQKAQDVVLFDDALQELVDNMVETMDAHQGQGIAAPQVFYSLRLFVVRFYNKDKNGDYYLDKTPTVFINPKLSNPSIETCVSEEGCLSIPGVGGKVERPKYLKIEALDRFGKPFSMDLTSPLHARVVMHENDHLNGVLFVDRLTKKDKHKAKQALDRLKKRRKAK